MTMLNISYEGGADVEYGKALAPSRVAGGGARVVGDARQRQRPGPRPHVEFKYLRA